MSTSQRILPCVANGLDRAGLRGDVRYSVGLRVIFRRLAFFATFLFVLLGHAGSAWAQAYCFPANWWGFDLVSSANGQATLSSKTCGCGSSARYIDSGGSCSSSAVTRTSSVASNGASWSVNTRSHYFSTCGNTSDIAVTGSCKLTGKSQWYSVVATCSNHNTTATVTMDSTITPLAPCVIQYMADSDYFNPVYVRDEIKFKNAITVTTPAPAYAAINTSFNVAATASVGSVTISTSGNCSATSTGSGTATITMTGASSADCVVTYTSGSDATYGADTVSSNTNNNYYEGIYNGIKLNWTSFWPLDGFMTCGPTCAVTSGNSHLWLGAGTTSYAGETGRTYGMLDADNPNDTWIIKVATGSGADTTYTIASLTNQKCLAKSGTYLNFATCNSADTAQQWKIAPFNGSDPADAPAGVELSLPAFPGLWANVSVGWYSYKFGMSVSADHDWTSAFFLGGKSALPDHIRFEFDQTAALTCQGWPVTIKTCADSTCSSLSTVSMTLAPGATKGTWSGLTAAPYTTYTGSSAGIKLSDTTAEATTLSYSMAFSMVSNSTLECYDTNAAAAVSCTNAATFTACSAYFDAVETTSPVTFKGGNLYTKLAGVDFNFDVVGPPGYTDNLQVDLVDESAGTWTCGGAGPTLLATSFTAPSAAATTITTTLNVTDTTATPKTKRRSFTANYANAAKKVRVRIRDGMSNCYVSTDHFTIRPKTFALTSTSLAGSGVAVASSSLKTSGLASVVTGMTLTATAMNGAATPATTTAYTATPAIDSAKSFTDWSTNTISLAANPASAPSVPTLTWASGGGLSAATAGVSSGSFYYNDFGYLSFPADSVIDSTYTTNSSDQANSDCVSGSTSNVLSSGKYGCNIGSSTLTTVRFKPDHYEAHLLLTPTCPATTGPPATSAFSYMGDSSLPVTVDLMAANADGGQMKRMWREWSATTLPSVAVTADNGGSNIDLDATHSFALSNSTSSSPGTPAGNPGSPWKSNSASYSCGGTSPCAGGFYSATSNTATSSGSFSTTFFRPTKPTSVASGNPALPYEAFKLTMTLTDSVDSGKISVLNGAAIAAAASVSSPTYKIRYGMLKLDNAYGSELLPLSVPVKAMYWKNFGTYQGWAVNTDDSCTSVPAARIATGNFKGALSILPSAPTITAFSAGVAAIAIPAPGAGGTGSVDIGVNLGSGSATSSACTSPSSITTGSAPGSAMSWLLNTCGGSYDKDPSARASFGTAKVPFLYRREKY